MKPARRCGSMLGMNTPATNSSVRPSRRFVLFPEQAEDVSSRGPRIRRYRLASVGMRSRLSEVDMATARMVHELSRAGRS
jgi:hypothetical protein